jgi:hypothetical protein
VSENTPNSAYGIQLQPSRALSDTAISHRVADHAPNGPVMLDLTLIDDWKHALRAEGKSSATIRRYLQAPRGFARYAGEGVPEWRDVEQRHVRRYLGGWRTRSTARRTAPCSS